MSIENDITARVIGKIIADGMHLANCNFENKIESEALSALKNIESVISASSDNAQKVENVKKILNEYSSEN